MIKVLKKFKEWKAAFLYGRAIMLYHKKKYNDSVRLLKEVCTLDPNQERIELNYGYIGCCYSALGDYDKAIKYFSLVYELIDNKGRAQEMKEGAHQEILEFLNAFVSVLQRVGQVERSQEVQRKAKELATEGTHKGSDFNN